MRAFGRTPRWCLVFAESAAVHQAFSHHYGRFRTCSWATPRRAVGLRPLAPSTEALMAAVEKATEGDDLLSARIGYARIEHFTWKDMLDFYTCTECGRCSDNCPAFTTGKVLEPQAIHARPCAIICTVAKKSFWAIGPSCRASREPPRPRRASRALMRFGGGCHPKKPRNPSSRKQTEPSEDLSSRSISYPMSSTRILLWGCTTCRACEEQCPVNITYVDKIVQMRRNLVVIKGEFPSQLGQAIRGHGEQR